MADNIKVVAATGTSDPPVATRDAGGKHYQIVLLATGASGSEIVVGSGNPMPISVSSLPLPTGAATETTVAAIQTRLPASLVNARFPVEVGNTTAIPVSVSGVATETTSQAIRDRFPPNLSGGGRLVVDAVGTVAVSGTTAISASTLPLPTGAATETTLAAINTKIPASPATDRTTAGGPFAARLTDGSAFYVGASETTAEGIKSRLPSALVGGRLSVDVGASVATTVVMSGSTVDLAGVAVTPKFVKIDAASSGNNTLVAAVSGKKIRVVGGMLMATADITVKFQSGAGGTDLTGPLPVGAKGGFAIATSPWGSFETASGALLNLNLSAGAVGGFLVYLEVS